MDNKIEEVKIFLNNDPSVILAHLFGSRVRSTSNHRSDWDFGIYFIQENLDKNPWHDFVTEAKLSRILKSEVQIVPLNKMPPPILGYEIIGKGICLTGKDENLKADYENRILRNYFDWEYFLKRK